MDDQVTSKGKSVSKLETNHQPYTFDVSIIVINWNTRDLLAKCLSAIYDTTHKVTYEIIVVDNASTDGSPEMVDEEFPEVRLIRNSENVGFARANNQAIRCSQGRYVLLLNSDAFVYENTIDRTLAFMDSQPEIGITGCRLLHEDGSLQRSCYSFPTLSTELYIAIHLDQVFSDSKIFGKYRMTHWDFNDIREVDVVLGAFMLVRSRAIKEVGLLDERYFMYSEEVDWCYRFKKKGWKVCYYPEAEAMHMWGGSSRQVQVETLIRMYRSRICFFRHYYGSWSAKLLKVIVGLGCLLRIGPGAWLYFLKSDTSRTPQKHRAFWQLLRSLPTL